MKKVSKKMVGDFLTETKGETQWIGWDFSMRFEMNNKRRITYNEMKPFEIYVREYSFDVVSPSK